MLRIRVLINAAPALFFGAAAYAQQLPNETDLKAAYCMGVIKKVLGDVGHVDIGSLSATPEMKKNFSEGMNKLNGNLRRLQMYLVPRIPYLDMVGIEAARIRGDEDESSGVQSIAICNKNCMDIDCAQRCIDKNEFAPRIRICYDLSFLPY